MDLNKLMLIGHVGKDPELKNTAEGEALCKLSLATNETFRNKAGEDQRRTEWHNIVAFGKLAEICRKYVTKGKLIYIEGSIRSGKWTDRNGNERKSYDIVARDLRMLSPGPAQPEQRPADDGAGDGGIRSLEGADLLRKERCEFF